MPKFKKGDVLRVVDASKALTLHTQLTSGDIFTLEEDSYFNLSNIEYVYLRGFGGWDVDRFKLAEEVEEQWTPKVGELIRVVGNRSSVRRFFVAFTHVGTLITTKEQGHLGMSTMCKFWGASYKAHRIEEFKPKKRIWSLSKQDWQYI